MAFAGSTTTNSYGSTDVGARARTDAAAPASQGIDAILPPEGGVELEVVSLTGNPSAELKGGKPDTSLKVRGAAPLVCAFLF